MSHDNKQFSFSSLLSHCLLLSLFLLLFVTYFHSITAITQDLGRHILTGEIITTIHAVPKTNLFSYTYPDFPFINSHWFSEVVFYFLHLTTGFQGLLFVMTLTVLGTYGSLVWSAKKHASIISISLASLLLFPVLFERTDLRPELFSFLFLSLFIVILYAYRERFTRLIFLLPFLELLWVNIHIYFLIGIIVLGLFFIDLLLMEQKNIFSQRVKVFCGVILVCIALTFCNPNGLSGALYPFTVFHNYGYTIEENQNVLFIQSLFNKASIQFFEVSVFFLFLSFFIAWKKVRPIDWLLCITFTILGATAVRNLPLFMIAVFIPFTYSLDYALKRVIPLIPKKYFSFLSVLFLLCLLLIVSYQIITTTKTSSFGPTVETGASKAVDYYLSHKFSGPLFNNFDIGSYLEYRLYPKEKVFVDGRPEAYPSSFFQSTYIPMQQSPEFFEKVAIHYKFQTILFSHTDQTPWGEQFISWVTKDPKWKIVYLDDTMIILRPASDSLPAITDQTTLSSPSSLRGLQQRAHFYSIVGWNKNLKVILEALLLKQPTSCPVLYNLALLSQQANDPASTIYAQKYQLNCHTLLQ